MRAPVTIWLAVLVVGTASSLACGRSDPPGPSRSPAAPAGDAGTAPDPLVEVFVAIARAEALRAGGVEQLVRWTGDPRPPVRARALRGLGRIGDAAALAELERVATGDGPLSDRLAAAGGLELAAAPTSVPALAQCLEGARAAGDAGIPLIATALRALGRAAPLEQQPLLAAALADARGPVRAAAARALGLMARRQIEYSSETRAALVALDRDTPEARHAIAFALAREHQPPKDEASVARLRELAADADPETRSLAMVGLARRSAVDAPAVAAGLADPDWRVRVETVRAAAAAPALRSDLATWTRAEWARLAGAPAGPTSDRVHAVLESLQALRAHSDQAPVARALADVHESAAPAGKRARWSQTPQELRARDAVHCLAAAARGAEALATCGDQTGAGWPLHLRRALAAEIAPTRELATDEDARVRGAALAAALAAPSPPKWALEIMEKAMSSEAVVEAGSAIEAVVARLRAGRAPAGMAEALRRRAEADTGAEVEITVSLLGGLAAIGSEDGLAMCRRFANHPNRTVRGAAVDCLKALDSNAVADPADVSPQPSPLPPLDPAEVIGSNVTWTLVTSKGRIEIELDSDAAPWHVAALVSLARKRFYDGTLWHRVVADFVVQGGDPTGSGWGGPGYLLPAEPVPAADGAYERGAVGIADAGLDTGGCQIFIMHTREPRLNARYTRVGRVTSGQEVVDALIVGDTIDSSSVSVTRR